MGSGNFKTSYRDEHKLIRNNWMRCWVLVLIAALIYLPHVLQNREIFGIRLSHTQLLGMSLVQVNFALIAIIGAVSLNLLTGYTGLISLGHAGFFAVGGIVGAFFGVQLGWPFPLVLLLSGLVGALVGVIVGLPSLRVRGLYLLLATLGLHFIMVYLFLRYQIANFGVVGVRYPRPFVFGWEITTPFRWYWLLLPLVAFFVIVTKNLLRSREGRAFVAIRDHDIAASAAGVNLAAQKLKAFAVSSFIATVAGTLFVWNISAATNEVFTLTLAIEFIAIIIIGGLGSILGAILGALLWQLLPGTISTLSATVDPSTPVIGNLLSRNSAQFNQLVLGAIIILVLVFKPDGLNGFWISIRNFFQRWPYTT